MLLYDLVVQRRNPGQMFKASKFNVLIPDFPGPGEWLVFNTLTDSRVVIDGRAKRLLEGDGPGRAGAPLDDDSRSALKLMEELGLVVPDQVDEDRELEYWFQKLKFDTSTLDVTILTTSACNLGCTYCFEEGIDLKGFLSDDKGDQACRWIEKRMDRVRPRSFHMTLFGGEPLLNPRAALRLGQSLYAVCRGNRVEQRISLITNGVLLTEEFVSELAAVGLNRIKVTLDGDEEAHDSVRRYKNGKGSYRTILRNLQAIKGKAPISIGGNFNEATKQSIPRLLDELLELGFTPEDILDITFKPILSPTGKLPVLNNAMDSGHACTFSEMNVRDILWLREEVEKRGFVTKEGIAIGPCCATRENSYTIDPWGRIYKCPALVGREEFITGDISDEEGNFGNTRFMTVDLWRDSYCQPCPYRPICGGGCRGSSVTQSGDFEAIACEKPYFENVAVELVKREYLKRAHGSEAEERPEGG